MVIVFFDEFIQISARSFVNNWLCVLAKMKSRRLEVFLGIVFAVFLVILAECATVATGTICEEIPLEVCSALPYSHTGFPNSLGHSSRDRLPPQLSSAYQTLIAIGCYDDAQLFLCAAAFPQCTSDGRLLQPCRPLCEAALLNCGFWFVFYSDLLGGVNCEAMPNSSDSSICVGLNSPQPHATSEQLPTGDVTFGFEATAQTETTNPASMFNLVSTLETLIFTPSSRQHTTNPSNQSEESKTEEHKSKKPANSTLLNYYFKSDVTGQRSTESKGGQKITDSIDKAVRTDTNLQDESRNTSAIPTLGIVLSVLSCVGMVVLLISCAFFRKAFAKPFGSHRRRKPRDGAFYTNPAFSDLPQGPTVTNTNGESFALKQQPYTIDDLPPHPASVDARPHPAKHARPNVYQEEMGGFVEQNLFPIAHLPHCDHAVEVDQQKSPGLPNNAEMKKPVSADESYRITSDLVYSNTVTSVTMDTNANEHGGDSNRKAGSNGMATAPPSGESFPMVSTNMDDSDMVIANPIAC